MADYDLIIRNGTVYDGSGSAPVSADVAVKDGRIAAIEANLQGSLLELPAGDLRFAAGFAYRRLMRTLDVMMREIDRDPNAYFFGERAPEYAGGKE